MNLLFLNIKVRRAQLLGDSLDEVCELIYEFKGPINTFFSLLDFSFALIVDQNEVCYEPHIPARSVQLVIKELERSHTDFFNSFC